MSSCFICWESLTGQMDSREKKVNGRGQQKPIKATRQPFTLKSVSPL